MDKTILITDGTGSPGRALTKRILELNPEIERLVIYSRDDQKQFKMNQEFPNTIFKVIRYFIGDVRDYERLKRAMTGIDCVIHEAVMKHVHIAEYNPDESIKNKERGAENIIKDCLNSNLKWYRLY